MRHNEGLISPHRPIPSKWREVGCCGMSKLRVVAMTSVALLVTGCGAGQLAEVQPKPLEPLTLSADQITTVQTIIRFSLQDPRAAQFGTIKGGKDQDGKVVVCGLVNAKNNFGGFTGMTFTGELRFRRVQSGRAGGHHRCIACDSADLRETGIGRRSEFIVGHGGCTARPPVLYRARFAAGLSRRLYRHSRRRSWP